MKKSRVTGEKQRALVESTEELSSTLDLTGMPDVLPALTHFSAVCIELTPAQMMAVLQRAHALQSLELTLLSCVAFRRLLALDCRTGSRVFARPGLACTLGFRRSEWRAECEAARESLLRAAPGLRSTLVVRYPPRTSLWS